MPRKLSETRIRILQRLEGRNVERDGAETPQEISSGLGLPLRGQGAVTNALRGLANAGHARRLNFSEPHWRAWTITDAGREALALAEGRPASSGEG